VSILKRLLDLIVPQVDEPKSDDLAFVAFADSEALAELWASVLRNAGVTASTFNGTPVSLLALTGGTDWRVRMRTLNAREILGEDENGVSREETGSRRS